MTVTGNRFCPPIPPTGHRSLALLCPPGVGHGRVPAPQTPHQPPVGQERGRRLPWGAGWVPPGCHSQHAVRHRTSSPAQMGRRGAGERPEVPGSSSAHWMSPVGSSEPSRLLVKGGAAPPPPGSAPMHRSEPGTGRSRTESEATACHEPPRPGDPTPRGAPPRLPGSQAPAAPRTAAPGSGRGQTPGLVSHSPLLSSSRGTPAPGEHPEPHLPPPGWGNAGIPLSPQTAGLGEQGPEGRAGWAAAGCCEPPSPPGAEDAALPPHPAPHRRAQTLQPPPLGDEGAGDDGGATSREPAWAMPGGQPG